MQRSQRDTQRRNDMSRFMSQITQYQASNNGKVPNTNAQWKNFMTNYMRGSGDSFTDPDGTDYMIANGTANAQFDKDGTTGMSAISAEQTVTLSAVDHFIHVFPGAICGDESNKVKKSTSGGTRKIAIIYKLETAGYYCMGN